MPEESSGREEVPSRMDDDMAQVSPSGPRRMNLSIAKRPQRRPLGGGMNEKSLYPVNCPVAGEMTQENGN